MTQDTLLSVAVCAADLADPPPFVVDHQLAELHGRRIGLALVRAQRPPFDPDKPSWRNRVLLRIQAFSCNFRDRSIVLGYQAMADAKPEASFLGFGSDFVAVVEAVGADVTTVAPGDRVIPDGAWRAPAPDDRRMGLPTNRASSRYLFVEGDCLAKIPDSLPTEVAAAFTIGAQTSYGMVRRLELVAGRRALVLSASSNTGLFTLQALRGRGLSVCGVTSDPGKTEALRANGADEVVVASAYDPKAFAAALGAEVARGGTFDGVVDPFYDLHLGQVLPFMAFGGRYITCGMTRQGEIPHPRAANAADLSVAQLMGLAMTQNLSIVGNCLGLAEDLAQAVADHAAGRFDVMVDSVFPPDRMAAFLTRSFEDPARLGKVVMVYED